MENISGNCTIIVNSELTKGKIYGITMSNGTLTLGENDGNVTKLPEILSGFTYNGGTVNFYDGYIHSFTTDKIINVPDGYEISISSDNIAELVKKTN